MATDTIPATDEKPITDEIPALSDSGGDVYELRVAKGSIFSLNSWKPDVTARIKAGEYFFAEHYTPARNKRFGCATYLISGLLHATKDGKFTLDYTFMTVGDHIGMAGTLRSMKAEEVVLGKSYEGMGGSGIATGYVFVISKVIKPAETPAKEGMPVHTGER